MYLIIKLIKFVLKDETIVNEVEVINIKPVKKKKKVILKRKRLNTFYSDICVICLEKDNINCIFTKCKHMCICKECYSKDILMCPICRSEREKYKLTKRKDRYYIS